jgi:hypothetical protein
MKRLIAATFFMMILGVTATAQTSMAPGMQNAPARKSPLSEYAGSWIGTFEGHTWVTIRLVNQGPALAGSFQRPRDLQFLDSGDLKSVSDEKTNGAIENAVLQGDGLLLTVKDQGSEQTEHYVLRLMSANSAELKMVGMAMQPGMPKPRPWQLSRVGPSAVAPVR